MVYRLVFILLLIIISPTVSEAGSFVDLHLISYHTKNDRYFNETNPGIIFRHEKKNLFYTTGIYQNSEKNISGFWGIGKTFGKGFIKTSISAGLVSGYKETVVMALSTLHIGRVNLNLIPDPRNRQVVFSLSVNFLNW